MKNWYLNLLAVLNFGKTQNELKRAETKYYNPQPIRTIRDQIFLTMFTITQVLTIPLLAEEPLFTWAFGIKRDVAPKQRYDRFSSAEGHIHVTPTFEYVWTTPRHTVIGGS